MSEATSDSVFPNTAAIWEPKLSDLKTYRHWDSIVALDEVLKIVEDPDKVAKHPFRPLLHFQNKWRRPNKNGEKQKPKVRDIRYACRKDAYIYKYYRTLLAQHYEDRLKKEGLQACVLAYRKIPVTKASDSHKNNIHFAKDAFDSIDSLGKCCAIAVDISDFFGSLEDHNIKRIWCELLGVERLPDDHKAVFKSIVNYRYVSVDDVMVALGYSKYDKKSKKLRYLVNPKKIPLQLCSPEDYRRKIVDAKLVKKREKDYGIPQGTPISDLIANMYLLEFDIAMKQYAFEKGGVYFRYSDDILLILPGDGRVVKGAENKISDTIKICGEKLTIKPSKTEITCYKGKSDSTERCYSLIVDPKTKCRKRTSINSGLSYLGFRYDGKKIFIRDSTLSNLRRKVFNACKSRAYAHVRGHQKKNLKWLLENSPVDAVKTQFMSVQDFEEAVKEALEEHGTAFGVMTFWSYIRRAKKIFGDRARKMSSQLNDIEDFIRSELERNITYFFKTKKAYKKKVHY